MEPQMWDFVMLGFAAWMLAVAVKALTHLRSHEPYRFSMWDGGMIREGKLLNRRGIQIKSIVSPLLAAIMVVWVARILDRSVLFGTLLVLVAISLISDFVNEGKE